MGVIIDRCTKGTRHEMNKGDRDQGGAQSRTDSEGTGTGKKHGPGRTNYGVGVGTRESTEEHGGWSVLLDFLYDLWLFLREFDLRYFS